MFEKSFSYIILKVYISSKKCLIVQSRIKAMISGDNSKEDTPVPIPNTEVKLFSADDTWWATAWKSKTLPDMLFRGSSMVEQPAVNR